MNTIKQPFLVDIFKDEYHLDYNQDSVDESTDMMRYKPKKHPNRPRLLEPSEQLTDEEEQNERIAEQIANKYGLIYVEQSCIGGKTSQYNDLLAAKRELSQFMDTDIIRHPYTPDEEIDWLFVFWS